MSPRVPIDLGPFDIAPITTTPRILRMTIKPVGSLDVSLPKELLPLQGFIQQVVEYERMINSKYQECEVHITTDYGVVEAQETQRFPGWHVDGLQGGKFKDKLMAEHSYVIATNNPTEFCLQPFFISHYDEDITNHFKAFDQQARESNIYRGLPNHLYLMDAYMVHRTPTITETTTRGFIRITVANDPLPIEHNTLNPMLDSTRAPFKLDIRDWLRAPDTPINYEYYGLSGKIEPQPPLPDAPSSPKKPTQDVGTFSEQPLTPGEIITVPKRVYPRVQPQSPVYQDMLTDFDARKYTNPRPPIDLGTANVSKIQNAANVLRMPLKWWDSEEIRIPEELISLRQVIRRVCTYDKAHNPLYHEQFIHVTHDTREIAEGHTHRFPGWHGDDLQGGSFPKKVTACHSYILTTEPGTEFCLQPFFISHVDETHEQLFTEFDRQAQEENVYLALPGHLYLMDPYMVHRTPEENVTGKRTFLRITFSHPDLLLPGNTLNPMFSDRQEEYDAIEAPHLDETRWTQKSNKHIPYYQYGIDR